MAGYSNKATRINLFSLSTPQMRAFHLTWIAFFVCFFAWFATAPLMPIIKGDLKLTNDEVYSIGIAGVFVTVLARFVIGPLTDKYGPRLIYTLLLAFGAIPVIGISFAWDYNSFLIMRLLIGIIGASFVITQFHTSVMFAPNVVGTANATVGGWGNAGGGVTQSVMPLILAGIAAWGPEQRHGVALCPDCAGGSDADRRRALLALHSRHARGQFCRHAPRRAVDGGRQEGWPGRDEDRGQELPRLAARRLLRRLVRRGAVRPLDRGHLLLQPLRHDGRERGPCRGRVRPIGTVCARRGRPDLRSRGQDRRVGCAHLAAVRADDRRGGVPHRLLPVQHGGHGGVRDDRVRACSPTWRADRSTRWCRSSIARCWAGCAASSAPAAIWAALRPACCCASPGLPQLCFMVLGIFAIICACGAASIRFSAQHKEEEQALYDAAVAQRTASSLPMAA